MNASLPIETHIVDFGTTTHYGTTAGRKELRAIEAELQRLRKITPKSVHLLRILGVKLTLPGDSRMVEADGDVTTPRLVIVSEQVTVLCATGTEFSAHKLLQAPTMSLWDALDTLEESGSWMSEAKASVCFPSCMHIISQSLTWTRTILSRSSPLSMPCIQSPLFIAVCCHCAFTWYHA